jgi:YidC/Oxa1 family membrane protein insertase
MEKRHFLFFIAIAISFFLVNLYFQYQHQGQVTEWNAKQKERKLKKIKQLEADIAQHSTNSSQLPLVEIYADAGKTQFLTSGVLDENNVITLAWDDHPPQNIFARPINSSKTPQEYYITYASNYAGGPIVYRKGLPSPLLIGNLPDFGKFDLQLVSLSPFHKEKPYFITIANYTDGHFTIPLEVLNKLKSEAAGEGISSLEKDIQDGVLLLNTAKGYLPVAVYDSKSKSVNYLEDISGLSSQIYIPEEKNGNGVSNQVEEKFYVLENDYQQLVFSNIGGALAEINLPFATKSDRNSVVRPIEFDREILAHHPYNDYFPSRPYYTASDKPEGPYAEHIEGTLGGYYPLLRRDLIESHNRKSIKIEPRFYALNIVSEYPETAQQVYTVKYFDKNTLIFESEQHHRKITKTYSIALEDKGAPYSVDFTIDIQGDARGLWLTTGIPEVEIISGTAAPVLKYRLTRQGKSEVADIPLPKDAVTDTFVSPDWICSSNGFLGMILNPVTEIDPGYRAQMIPGVNVPSRLIEIDQAYQRFKAQDLPGYLMQLPLKSHGGTMKFHFFAGPFADDILKDVDNFYSDPDTGYNPDFLAAQTFHGWFAFISEPFADFLFVLMKLFHQLTGSWAFSIILLTIALRLMLYPLNAWSMKSMARMQQVAPELTAIQEKYKKDPKKAQVEIMNLYRERGINPMTGCLPLLIQMPFLIGMFDLLKSTFELRGASFIPGWIDNLTAPDVLFSWKTQIFFIGNQFHLLPFLLGAVMFIQQRMSTTLPKDPNLWTEQQRQQRVMGTVMTVVFTVMFYNFPSGLNIYWLSSMLLGIVQQWWIQKHLPKTQLMKKTK